MSSSSFKCTTGEERIYTAGEKEYDGWMYRKDKGVPITEAVQKEFIHMREEMEWITRKSR